MASNGGGRRARGHGRKMHLLREDTNFKENETMVEGTLLGFAFHSDEELERPAVEKAGSAKHMKHVEGGDDGKETKKNKVLVKAPGGKIPTKKAEAGTSEVGGKAKELATDLKQELAEKLMDLDVVKFSTYPSKIGAHEKLGMQIVPLKDLVEDQPKAYTVALLKNKDPTD